jgi:hypothetical protein
VVREASLTRRLDLDALYDEDVAPRLETATVSLNGTRSMAA